MTFTKLEFSNGNEVYVNPDHVRYVTKDDCNEGMSNVSIQGMTLHVKGEAWDIVGRMIHDSRTEAMRHG